MINSDQAHQLLMEPIVILAARLWAVAVGAALLFKSGFRRPGPGVAGVSKFSRWFGFNSIRKT